MPVYNQLGIAKSLLQGFDCLIVVGSSQSPAIASAADNSRSEENLSTLDNVGLLWIEELKRVPEGHPFRQVSIKLLDRQFGKFHLRCDSMGNRRTVAPKMR